MPIHKTAVIEDGAIVPESCFIGPYCVVGSNVVLEDGVTLKSHVVVSGHTSIGSGTTIYPFASIGEAPQDLKYNGEPTRLIIGKNNTIREHATMNPGTVQGNNETVIGDNNLFMMATHVAHDCILGSNIIMANNATLGGHVIVGDYAIIGGLAAVHQFIRIGGHAIIGGMSGVESDVIPYGRVKGERASLAGLNLIGLERRGFSKDDVKELQKAYNHLFKGDGTLDDRTQKARTMFDNSETIQDILNFIEAKDKFPICQPAMRN